MPEQGAIFVALNSNNEWAEELRFLQQHETNPDVALFWDKTGEVFELPWSSVKRPGLARDEAKVKAEADKRLYNNRSRTTAKQRGQRAATEKQRRYLIGLATRRGLSIEDLRDMTPQKSIRKLTVFEAGRLIDRFLGKSRKTGS